MKKQRTNNYQRRFVLNAVRYIPHHALLHVAMRFDIKSLVRFLDWIAKKFILNNATIQINDINQLSDYRRVAGAASIWHGSGRLQHSRDGLADVLDSILKNGGLQPVEDVYAIFSGGERMTSISLTRSRSVARSYADMHGKGYLEKNRYGDALTWVAYYYGLFYARLYTFGYPSIKKYYKTWHRLTHDDNGHNTWGKKVNNKAEDVWDIFCLGSDIPNNYPILFGVKNVNQTIQLNKIFSDYEVRTPRAILLSEITHIEVPALQVDKTQIILKQHNISIPVFSIEIGEYAASKRKFSQLLGWQKT